MRFEKLMHDEHRAEAMSQKHRHSKSHEPAEKHSSKKHSKHHSSHEKSHKDKKSKSEHHSHV